MSTQTRRNLTVVLACLLGTISLASFARPGQGDQPRMPPLEAIEACESLSEGDSCSFEGRRDDTVEGTCSLPPEEVQEQESSDEVMLACKPDHGDEERGERPSR